MAVLGSSIPIASFYCRRKDNFCCCGDITPKFGDFTTIPLPAPVAGTTFSADMRLLVFLIAKKIDFVIKGRAMFDNFDINIYTYIDT